jgi:bifunctional glutamyl/prolyl-tRNA synthetase
LKLTWLAETSQASFTPITCVHYDNIMTKVKLDEGDKFENFVNYASKVDLIIQKENLYELEIPFFQTEYDLIGEPDMAQLKKGDVIQILRKGYYVCDAPYDAATRQPCVLFNIPDGTKTEKPTALKTANTAAAGDTSNASGTVVASGAEVDQLVEQIVQQGETVRELKANKSTPKVNKM